MKHLMVDIETMGTSSRAAIVAIGAVVFEPFGQALATPPDPVPLADPHYLYRPVKLATSLAAGLEIDAGTVEWWLCQSEEARTALLAAPVTLKQALHELAEFAAPCQAAWSHGATFDLVILDAAYRAVGKRAPWGFRDCRDTRTLFDLAFYRDKEPAPMPAAHRHHALWDAWRQSIGVQGAYRKLGLVAEAANA